MSWNWWIASSQMSLPGDLPHEAIDQAARTLGGAVASTEGTGQITAFLAVPAETEQDAIAAARPGLGRAARILGTTAGPVRARPSGGRG